MKKTIRICDSCANEIVGNEGAVVQVRWDDGRRQNKQADMCSACASSVPGEPVARRGRRPAGTIAT